MPDELELLEKELRDYEEWMFTSHEQGYLGDDEYRHKLYTIADFREMIEKVRERIKDFEDTVSGSGG